MEDRMQFAFGDDGRLDLELFAEVDVCFESHLTFAVCLVQLPLVEYFLRFGEERVHFWLLQLPKRSLYVGR